MDDRDQPSRAGLDRHSNLPLWRQLREELRHRLEAGEFSETFPPERELVADYRVSRHTVRQAVRGLREAGIVQAGRGRMSRLSRPDELTQPLGTLYSLFTSVEASGMTQRNVVHDLGIHADGVIATRLGLEESTPLLSLRRLRLAGGEPLALDHVWLPAALAAPLVDVDFEHTSLYRELAALGVHLVSGHEQLRAVTPTPRQRRQLTMPIHTAAFAIDRLGCTSHGPVEWRHTLIRGDRFSLTAEFSPQTGYQLQPRELPARRSRSSPTPRTEPA